MADSSDEARRSGIAAPGPRRDLHRQVEETLAALRASPPGALDPEKISRLLSDLAMDQIELEERNEETRQALTKSDSAPTGHLAVSEEGLVLEANLTAAALLGMARDEMIHQPFTRFILHEDQHRYVHRRHELSGAEKPSVCRMRLLRSGGRPFWALLEMTASRSSESGPAAHRVAISDITELKQQEIHDVMIEIVRLFNEASGLHELIRGLTGLIADWSGCDAVGIRLQDGDDFPYFETRGFPAEFVRAESRLCATDPSGNVLRDDMGNPVIECMCGNVICGRFDPSKPFFSKNGSFWTNCTTRLLTSTTEADRQSRTRNRCNGEGYESVALIPIRSGGRTLGLLQLNDKREQRFTPERIAVFEQLGATLGIGLAYYQSSQELRLSEEHLRKSENRQRALLDNIPDPAWLKDPSGRYQAVNGAWCRLMGISPAEAVGRTDRELMPNWTAIPSRQEVEVTLGSEPASRREEVFTDVQGHSRVFDTIETPIMDDRGLVAGTAGIARDITDRKRIDEALRASEERYRSLVAASPLAVLVHRNGRIEFVNRSAMELFGANDERQLLGRSPFELLHPEYHKVITERIEQLAQGKAAPVVAEKIIRLDGTARDVEVSACSFTDCDGLVIQVTFHDITDRLRAEAAIQEVANEWKTTFDAVGDAVWLLDTHGRIIRCNRAGAEAFGQTTDELTGHLCWELTHGTGRAPTECPFLRMRQSLGRESCESTIGDRWFQITVDPILDRAGALAGAVHIMSDITNRKRAEAALRESEAHYRSLFANILEGFACCRMYFDHGRPTDFVYLEVNSAFERLTGLHDVVGKRVSEVIPGIRESSPELFEVYGRVSLTGQPEKLELHLPPLDMWLSISVYSLRKEEFIAVFDNITKRKRAEQERGRLQDQLWQIQKLDALGRMAAGMAHDFGNYLSVIRSSTQSILDSATVDGKGLDSLHMVKQAADESMEMVRSLLTFSRGSSSTAQVIELEDAVQSARTLLKQALPKNVTLEIVPSVEPPCRVRVDVTQLHQVLLNLALNSRDAMPDGGTLRIAVSSKAPSLSTVQGPSLEGHDCAQLTVSDSGEGMAAEVAARIFEPFFSTKARGAGSGLGLAIVHGLVTNWGGSIDVRSQPGTGTTFTILIPLVKPAGHGERDGGFVLRRDGEGQTVLLCGIEPYLRSFIVPTLANQGYVVISADTKEAIAKNLESAAVRLLVQDVQLLTPDVREYLHTALPRRSDVKAIVLARKGYLPENESGENARVMEEPYSLDDLVTTVFQVMHATGPQE